jgi:lipoate-protein ligase B
MPCGLAQCHITSMAEVRQCAVSPSVVAQQVAQEFARIFNTQWTSLTPDVMRQEHHDHHLTSTSFL